MGKKSKATKKFSKNHLAQTISDRRKHQAKRKEVEGQRQKRAPKKGPQANGNGKRKAEELEVEDGTEDDEGDELETAGDMTVDDLLNAKGMGSVEESDEDEDEGIEDDLRSIGSEDESAHGMDLGKLKETDPEFYKYLQENDRDLLDFDPDADTGEYEESVAADSTAASGKGKKQKRQTVVTKPLLKMWQRAILEKRSLRTMRKLLIAFRSAVFSANEDAGSVLFVVESSSVFNALAKTTFKYTPVYLSHTVPAKELPSGKFKIATNSKLYASAQRLLKSYFSTVLELISQLPVTSSTAKAKDDAGDSLLYLSLSESAKLTPWIVGNRKLAKLWAKTLFELWATAEERVRIAAYLALRRLAMASDPSMQETVLKGLYTNIVRSAKATSAHTLPAINLMKNSAVELFLVQPDASYTLIFGFIRQLAIHLRNSIKLKTKEGFQAVYNWQFLHGLDFWSLVLSAACDQEAAVDKGQSPLHPLIYPLVQITLGAMTLIPTSRYFPLRFQCIRLLLRLSHRTSVFIPLAPYLLSALDSPDLSSNPKPSNLPPFDWSYFVRTPKQYQRTRVFADSVAEEASFLLLEFYSIHATSIAFPELAIPVTMQLKRLAKKSKNPKFSGVVRALAEKLEGQAKWIEDRRAKVDFAPADREKVAAFLGGQDPAKTPIGVYFTSQSKAREQKRAALERVAASIVPDDEDE